MLGKPSHRLVAILLSAATALGLTVTGHRSAVSERPPYLRKRKASLVASVPDVGGWAVGKTSHLRFLVNTR